MEEHAKDLAPFLDLISTVFIGSIHLGESHSLDLAVFYFLGRFFHNFWEGCVRDPGPAPLLGSIYCLRPFSNDTD